jgi:hypothetical protein
MDDQGSSIKSRYLRDYGRDGRQHHTQQVMLYNHVLRTEQLHDTQRKTRCTLTGGTVGTVCMWIPQPNCLPKVCTRLCASSSEYGLLTRACTGLFAPNASAIGRLETCLLWTPALSDTARQPARLHRDDPISRKLNHLHNCSTPCSPQGIRSESFRAVSGPDGRSMQSADSGLNPAGFTMCLAPNTFISGAFIVEHFGLLWAVALILSNGPCFVRSDFASLTREKLRVDKESEIQRPGSPSSSCTSVSASIGGLQKQTTA